MPDASDEIVLVTPVWNDAARLDAFGPELAVALASAGLTPRWVHRVARLVRVNPRRAVAFSGEFFSY